MSQQFETIQKFGKDSVEATLKSFDLTSKGTQAITLEAADFAKKSFEAGAATFEKLIGAKSLDKAIEIQTEYLKGAYDDFIVQSTKISTLYANLAKEVFKPYEGLVAPVATKPVTKVAPATK
jgi:hypothetical protein